MKKTIVTTLAFTAFGLVTSFSAQAQFNSLNPTGKVGVGTTSPNQLMEIRDTVAHPNHGGAPAFLFEETYYTNSTNTSPIGTQHTVFEIRQKAIYDTYPGSSTSNPSILDNTILSAQSHLGGGKVGIGTSSPLYTLDVQGDVHSSSSALLDGSLMALGTGAFGTQVAYDQVTINGDLGFDPNHNVYRHIKGRSDQFGLALYGNTSWNNGGGILLNGGTAGNNPGGIDFVSTESTGPGQRAFSFWDADAGGNWNKAYMSIYKDGQVLIGSSAYAVSANDYKLYVETGILTEKVKIATLGSGAWADFVFEEDYSLRSLEEVENYIGQNHHLPDVPSAEEVEKNGFDLAEMDAILLRKIEELTLYMIELKKENERLKAAMNPIED